MFMDKLTLKYLALIGLIYLISLGMTALPRTTRAFLENSSSKFCEVKTDYEVVKTVKMVITAYSSAVDQTDNTPFVTASGRPVKEGIIANNMLPFGTKVRIPELYGEKVFVVQDRMHQRKGRYHVDIWFSEYKQAKEFGAKLLDIEVLES